MSKRIRLPGFKGVPAGPPGRLIAGTALREIARAIGELVDASERDGVPVPAARRLEPEVRAVETLLRQRAALLGHAPVNDALCQFAAMLAIEGMIELARLTDGGAP